MLDRSRDRGFCHPLGEINRLFEQMFGGLMASAEGNHRVPIVVGA
jgi:hypothetical protein